MGVVLRGSEGKEQNGEGHEKGGSGIGGLSGSKPKSKSESMSHSASSSEP